MPKAADESTIREYFAARREELIRDLATHVAIPTGKSFSPGLEQYRAVLRERLERLGATIELLPSDPRPWWLDRSGRSASDQAPEPQPVMIARSPAGEGPRILITGHLDTVHDPHGPFREMTIGEDGRFATGPGVVDMKGGVLIALAALEALHEQGIRVNWTLLLNADEEMGSFQSARVIREESSRHDVGIAVEPALADGSLAIERMGSGQFMIEVFGQSAHVGREFEKGVSAVTKLGEVLVALGRMADLEKGRIVNVGPLEGGSVTNAVPDYACCWGNVRYATPEAGEELARMIEAMATDEDAMPRVVVHRQWNRAAKPETPAVRRFAEYLRAVAEELGQSLPFAKTGGVCDGNIMQSAGLQTLDTLGVRGGNLHRPDEFIELASLVERGQLLAILLARIGRGQIAIRR